MPTETRIRSSGKRRSARAFSGIEAWDMRQGREICEATQPKLTEMVNSSQPSTIRRESWSLRPWTFSPPRAIFWTSSKLKSAMNRHWTPG